MQKRSRKKKRPDINILAVQIVEETTGETTQQPDKVVDSGKDPAAVELGRRGGLKGGKARWKGTTKKERSEIARKAALARWKKTKKHKKKPS